MSLKSIGSSTLLLISAALLLVSPLYAQDKPLITPQDFGKWESISATHLSPDGKWLAYALSRVNEENETRIRGGANDTTIVIPFGTQLLFTADSKWVACLIGVAPKERDRLLKEKKPVRNSFVARNLETGESFTIADVASFTLSGDAHFIAISRYPADGKHTADVLVQNLATGTRLMFSNVSEHAWNDTKPMLAFAVAVEGGIGNGVQLFDGSTNTVRVLESSPSLYRSLTWRAKSDDIALLRTKIDKEFSDTAHAIVAWVGVSANSAPKNFDAVSGMPAGTRVTDYRRPSWSKDGSILYLGLRKRDALADAPKKSEDKFSDVEVWHPKDIHVIPDQRSSEQRDLRSTMLGAWKVGDNKVVQIGSEGGTQATVLDGDRFATELDAKPYAFGTMFGRRDNDVWLVETMTGGRTKVLEKIRFFAGADPTGKRLGWFDGRNYWTMNIADGSRVNVTAKLTAVQKVGFVDLDDDHPNNVRPPIGTVNWSRDGMTMFVNSEYDVWAVAADGSGGKRLTNGANAGVVYRLVSFTGFGSTATDRAIDADKPVYLSMFGKRTKKSGYARIAPNGEFKQLLFADASYASISRADSTDTFVFTRQRFDESPNAFVASDFTSAKQMSATNAFQKDYAWGKAELMNFTSTIGVPLQAILYYPANYDTKKKYPMIVYTYELLTSGLHRYIAPRENDYYNTNVFTQNGYFVLMPDIVFRPREPGVAVLHSVEPAVRAVIKRGLVDSARVGHAGHSQGGYEAAYLATHSKLFATAVMGSGISDMISFAGQMHWGSVPEFDHWETGQFRMQVPPWEDMPAMVRNSPLDKIHEMPARSVLVEIGGEDPTVDMRQGVEFYNYARRAKKNVVMLLYPGEGHSLAKKENAIDYERRILQWFAHYLKGEPAAKWITEGQTWIDRKKVLDTNK